MNEAETDTTELTAHEFRAELPCEHSGHNVTRGRNGYEGHRGGGAIWDYRFDCLGCGKGAHASVCDAFRVQVRAKAVFCGGCGTRYPGGDGVATFDPIPEATP